MMVRMKSILLVLLILVIVFLRPAVRVLAEETKGTYSVQVPYLEGIAFNMLVNSGEDRHLWDLELKNKSVEYFQFEFNKLSGIVYENYEVVFDMVLKSQLPDGQITTHAYSRSFDVSTCKPGFFDGWNAFLMNLSLKDDFYQVKMDFGEIVQNSPDCIVEEKNVYDSISMNLKKKKVYNTVITQVDCYLREKTSGNIGLVSRFILTWDSQFINALCTNVTYNLVVPIEEEILGSGSITNNSGSYGYNSDGNNWFYDVSSLLSRFTHFLTDIPNALYILVSKTYTVSFKFLELLKVVFPFFPSVILGAIVILLFYSIVVAVWKFFKG